MEIRSLLAVGVCAVVGAAGAAASAADRTTAGGAGAGGFAGRPTAPARPLDRDVETGTLRRVACAAGPQTTTCWISTSSRG